MNKVEYFLHCMNQSLYMYKDWINRAFAIVRNQLQEDKIPLGGLIQDTVGFSYKDDLGNIKPITDGKPGTPLYVITDPIQIKKGQCKYIDMDIETTYGRVLYYHIVSVYPFGDKFPFTNKPFDIKSFEKTLVKLLVDEDDDGNPDSIKPTQLEKYYEAVAYTKSLAMLFVPSVTAKAMVISDEVLKRREELFNDPKTNLNDPAVASQVENELLDLDRQILKDDPSSGFLINKKDVISRKKRYISFGAPPIENSKYIKDSLNEGININDFPHYMNEMRDGSFKRGVETQKGGELGKWLVRQSSNTQVDSKDCGSTIGIPTLITDSNKTKWLGFYIIDNKKLIMLDENNIGSYINKVVMRRSPATCKTKSPDFCHVCLGKKLSMNPDAVSIAISQMGSDFMGESMSAMHGKQLSTSQFDLFSEAR